MSLLDFILSIFRKAQAFPDSALVPPELVTNPKTASRDAVELIKAFEGLHKLRRDGLVEAYLCPAKVPTIGYGATGPDIHMGLVWSRQDCENRLIYDMKRFEREVARLVEGVPTTQSQFDALTSFAFNCGSAALAKSTLLKRHRAGDYAGAAAQFARWNKGGGKVLPGLTRRRAAEAALYAGGQ